MHSTGELQNCLKQMVCMSFFGFFGWFCVLCMNALYHMKKSLNFDGLSGQEKIGQHFSINCYKMATQMKHLHTCLIEKSPLLFSSNVRYSTNKVKR